MSSLKSIRLTASANLKLALVGVAFLIVAGTLFYTQRLAERMKASERKTIVFYASLLRSLNSASSQMEVSTAGPEISALAYDLSEMIDFPMVMADNDSTPKSMVVGPGDTIFHAFIKNVDIDTTLPAWQQRSELRALMGEMGERYAPLKIYAFTTPTDSALNTLIFYDDSAMIQQMQMFPIVGIVIISMFVLVGYISFSHIKRNEQSNIWVGMAKETAHQLGTPLSSLLGWIELLRYMPEDRAQVLEAADEMERDVERLNKIAHRFSKIGSAAELRPVDLRAVLLNVQTYFERRLPHLGRKVSLEIDAPESVWSPINVDLFEWVFENLVRNAADAIEHESGRIVISLRQLREAAIIDVSDNGRGIDAKIRKDIFRPGFSTKSRGWGLGLSLAKRIVEDYHGGRITIKASSASGTTFRIRLATSPPPESAAPAGPTDATALRAAVADNSSPRTDL